MSWWRSTQCARSANFSGLIAAGDAALARDETSNAIEAFSGALALNANRWSRYLKRGDTYRRRGELTAALRDLGQAAALDPAAPRPVELLGDVTRQWTTTSAPPNTTGRSPSSMTTRRAFSTSWPRALSQWPDG